MVNRGQEAPEVYVKLVLTARKSRVDSKREPIGLRRPSVQALQIRSGAPGRFEVIRRIRRLQPRVLDPNEFSRRRQDSVRRPKWRPEDDVALLLAARQID